MPVGGRVDMAGIDLARRREEARLYTLQDTRGLAEQFEDAVWSWLDQLWAGRGKVSGKYGAGTKKWKRNAPATIEKKGFNDPLHSQPGYSSIKERGYHFNAWHQRRGGGDRVMARFRVWAERMRGSVNYAAVNHYGSSKRKIPARPHMGFPSGAQRMLRDIAAKRGLTSRGWRAGTSIGRMARMLTRTAQNTARDVSRDVQGSETFSQ